MKGIANPSTDRRGYDPNTQTFHVQYNWEATGGLTSAIVGAIAEVTGEDPGDMDPIYESVDPVDLENVLESMGNFNPHSYGSVQFEHGGRFITVDTTGEIQVECRPDDDLRP